MRGGRGGMGASPPRFRGGGRGFMPPPMGGAGGGGQGHRNQNPPDNRLRAPVRFRNWQDGYQGINEPEVFAETPLPDGRVYYYNTRTRETMWERPQGPGVRIIRHDEVNWSKDGEPGHGQAAPAERFEHAPGQRPGPNGQAFGGPFGQDDQGGRGREQTGPEQRNDSPTKPQGLLPPMGQVQGQDTPPRPMLYPPPGSQKTSPGQRFQPPGAHNPQMMGPPVAGVPNSGPPRMDGFNPQSQQPPTMGPPVPGANMPPHGFLQQHPPAAATSAGPPQLGLAPAGTAQFQPPATGQFPPQGPGQFQPQGGPGQFPPPGAGQFQPPGAGQFPPPGVGQFPPPGAGQFPPPNYGVLPPPWGFPPMVPPAGVPPPMANSALSLVDPALVALAAEWTEHISPEGTPYYFSSKTQASVWEKPKVLIDLDSAKIQAQQRANILAAQQAAANASTLNSSQTAQESPDKTKAAKKPEKKIEKCRPISSTPVTGTGWCVVWTGDRRVFFYSPANKTSVWERPQELIGRLDVDEMVRVCPPAKIKRAEATSTTSPSPDLAGEKRGKTDHTLGTGTVAPVPTSIVTHTITIAPILPKRLDDTQPPGEEIREKEHSAEPPLKKPRTTSEGHDGAVEPPLETPETKGENETGAGPGKSDNDAVRQEQIETKDALREMTALEAEAKASRERAIIPMEVRLKQFREMLIETNVSAFSTWEKELHKIVFDQRYLLLTSNERKKAFDRYVEEIVEEERKEKQNRLKETKAKFLQFLSEVKISARMNYNEFSQRYGRDERFREVEKTRDREAFFLEYTKMVQKKEKEERTMRKEKESEDFLKLLFEKVKDYRLTFSELRKKLESDPRYQLVEPQEREDLFKKFQKRLRQEQRTQEQERKRERAAAREKKDAEKKDAGDKDSKTSEEDSSTDKPKGDPTGAEDISEEEEGCITDDSDEEVKHDREKQERAEQSIREREKEVQRSLATHLRDRDKEREFHRHEEAVQELQALMTDLIRTPDIVWRDGKRTLKKDSRWKFVSQLPRPEMEELFITHVEEITRKRLQRFKELLEENRVNTKTKWRDLYPKIKNDPRCTKFSASERKCQREFEEYIRDKQAHMKVEFRELLKETKMLNYKTLESLKQNPNMMREIESHLGNDRRYLQLDNAASERERLLNEYLEDLEIKGPPPPPTASEPTRRK